MFFAVKEKTIFDAHELYLSGKYDKALSLCEQILAKNPESYSALNIIANIYFIKDEFQKGEQYLYKMKDFFVRRKEFDKAIGIMERLLSIRPNSAEYMKVIADIYDRADKEDLSIRQQLKIADLYRHEGDFKACAGIYTEMTAMYPHKPELIKKTITSLALIGAFDKMFKVAKSKVFPSGNFDMDEKDDVLLLCAENGASADVFKDQILHFLNGGSDRLSIIENSLIKYFTDHKNDKLFNDIAAITGREALNEIAKIVSLTSPENIPEESPEKTETADENIIEAQQPEEQKETEPAAEKDNVEEPLKEEPEEVIEAAMDSEENNSAVDETALETFETDVQEVVKTQQVELDTHMQTAEENIETEAIELDSFNENDTEPKVDDSVEGLEKFEPDEEQVEVSTIEELESFDIAPVKSGEEIQKPEETPAAEEPHSIDEYDVPEKPAEDLFSMFASDDKQGGGDIFSAFDDVQTVEKKQEYDLETEQAEEPKEKTDQSKPLDIFEGMHEEKKKDKEKIVEKIDMSDVKIESREQEDMFADLVEEKKEKKPSYEAQKKIEIDKSDITPSENEGKDIFDMEV
ncbi:MAG: hypothetical protein C0602_13580 [Denitrovibrio sp.]|nr:MAG: hypothetical protein C0602_13580 [Denitrovibrio sp.]